MYKFKLNDQVKITAGKDKGQTGKVIKLFPKMDKLIVEGKNLYTRHIKASAGKPGSKTKLPRPIPTANIALVCPSCQKTTRVGFDITQKPKIRICRRCGQVIKNQVETKK
jgi:large subunit ribosomal protein L24